MSETAFTPRVQVRVMQMLYAMVLTWPHSLHELMSRGQLDEKDLTEEDRRSMEMHRIEREKLLNIFDELNDVSNYWADPEYEWFINRCLDHLGAR